MSRTDRASRPTRDSRAEGAAAANTESRKAEHIRVNLREDVTAKGIDNGFDEYRFIHRALPEIDLADVDTGTVIFGRSLAAPLLISCMTGGTGEARRLNRVLARVAQRMRLAMGLGSGRALLERPELIDTFEVRSIAPDVLLFANLGAVQLARGYDVDDCRRLVGELGADALVLHLNALQEAVQPEGDTCFSGLLARIAIVCEQLEVPVVVKEVGWGIDPDTVRALLDAGVAAVDVAGAGGTSWSEVERYRASDPWRARVAAAFAGWGIPTAVCLRQARRVAGDALVFASGGIRDGIDAAKAMALGADLVGVAGPFLRAAAAGEDEAHELALEIVAVLRIAMFAIGARTLAELRQTTRLRHRGEYIAARAAVRRAPARTPGVRHEVVPGDVEAVVRGRGDTHERAD
jgi:isopentenyl-diphosphate delta-isomerase